MSSMMLGVVIFVLLAVVALCVSAAASDRSSAIDERLAEMGAKMRVSYGSLDEQEIESAADVWRETLEVIDRAARQVQALSARRPGIHPSLDRVLEIRHAASDMLALYA